MDRLLIFADIHGSHTAWLTVKALANPGDGIAVAGDLFDTRYGSYSSPDFSPELIRSDLKTLDFPFYYVYGNCDVEGFCKGYSHELTFKALGKNIFIHHGHKLKHHPETTDIIIQGHTHLPQLETVDGQIFMNPGSIVLPRNSLPSYGVLDSKGIRLIALNTGKLLAAIDFS